MNELFNHFEGVIGAGTLLQQAVMLLAVSLLRVYAVFLVLPATSDQALQGPVRNGLCICLALFIAWGQPLSLVQDMDMVRLVATLAKEALIGLVLGFAASTVFWVAEGVGVLIDNQAGYNNVQQTNPLSGEQSTPIGNLLAQLAISGFYLLGGMLMLSGLLFDSFHWWPIGSLGPAWSTILEDFVRAQTARYLELMIKIAAPALLVLMLVDLGFGVLSKTADKLEPNNLAQPVKGAVAIAMLSLLVAVFFDQVRPALSLQTLSAEMAQWARMANEPRPVEPGKPMLERSRVEETAPSASESSELSPPSAGPVPSASPTR
ncbi:type III secretion system export apparatus subunit SctT [Roseateles terrae]|uniref:Type III secretion protein T n=1 Tax=Roseateles terrae TaxID=431060 RepID=A0ABR6GPR5_9BURK|nr:type III secretion system export apparatus subunit SctT [Roseateles terrae]MBB3193677.1 type III secretion protein T [Roseateles terrae]OWQ89163.1 EscT/YscT/HrcT family type III secretion system export apparatus protein [Roseateles terrae]